MQSQTHEHGCNSPPLELTGSHIPMGASSVNAVAEGRCVAIEAVLDADQRKRKLAPIPRAKGRLCVPGRPSNKSFVFAEYFEHKQHVDDVLKKDSNKLEGSAESIGRRGGPRIMGESLSHKLDQE
ncbi:hypothetical protein AAF712_011036 [Marasmius tenuissimus]|uniref:Uncharacterized protein n=1 Tax=Marasmius tenuissimus TaxID=585030 RepID=A0ABR2ZME9_9AGAR